MVPASSRGVKNYFMYYYLSNSHHGQHRKCSAGSPACVTYSAPFYLGFPSLSARAWPCSIQEIHCIFLGPTLCHIIVRPNRQILSIANPGRAISWCGGGAVLRHTYGTTYVISNKVSVLAEANIYVIYFLFFEPQSYDTTFDSSSFVEKERDHLYIRLPPYQECYNDHGERKAVLRWDTGYKFE